MAETDVERAPPGKMSDGDLVAIAIESMSEPMRDEMGMPLPVKVLPKKAMREVAPELLTRGRWVCLNIEFSCPWPTRPQRAQFGGHTVWIIPLTKEEYPGVAVRRPPEMSQEDADSLLYRFLSVLAWREEVGIAVAHRTGGSMPFMMGRMDKAGFITREPFDLTELACPEEVKLRIALALIREARSLNHYGYAFLSFWRVLELAFGKATADRVTWMQAVLPTLNGPGVKEAMASIIAQDAKDICRHLFESGRCAIAHATGEPIVNPDDPQDTLRLYSELPLVREMAIRVVEERFGLATPMTLYRQHLYELRGWRSVLGEALLASVAAAAEPEPGQVIDLPPIHVRLRTNQPYGPFEGMIPKDVQQQSHELLLIYGTKDDLVQFHFRLAPGEERLKFDIFNGIYGKDDGSILAAEYKRETARFFRDYLLNGELQMWNADSGTLLSRLDAYIPENIRVDLDACNASIAAAQEEVQRRWASSAN
jgi:hypothetical protein